MAYRDKNIEDLTARYTAYLAGLDSSDIAYLAEDPELYVMPEDELTPLIELLEARQKELDEPCAGLEYAIEIIEAIL